MWSPTHIQVTVHRARNLLAKGKNGRNNCYVTISVGKDKFMTTLQKDAETNLEWHEQCELAIPEKGNSAELVLTCLHQNSFGLDDFLGQLTLPLSAMDVYEQPRPRWYPLRSKPGKEKQKERGELEVRIGFTVKAGSLTDLNKKDKHKSSIGQNVGGSLLSINTLEKRKNLKKFAKSLGSKMHITGKKDKQKDRGDTDSVSGSQTNVWPTPDQQRRRQMGGLGQVAGEADPGVISEDEDEFAFDNLSHKSSGSSLNVRGFPATAAAPRMEKRSPAVSVRSAASSVMDVADGDHNRSMTLPTPAKPPRTIEAPPKDEWAEKLYGNAAEQQQGSSDSLKRRSWEPPAAGVRVPLAIPKEEQEGSDGASPTKQPNSATAPSSPAVASTRTSLPVSSAAVPQPLPRSNTMESIAEKSKQRAEKENKFTKKLKYFKREFGRSPEGQQQDEGTQRQKASLSGQFFHSQAERIIIGHENDLKPGGELPKEIVQRYENKSREEIITVAYQMENEVRYQKQKVKELEDYLDNLLLRVMETHPKILQNPYSKLNPTKRG